jgi:Methyltransferase domain
MIRLPRQVEPEWLDHLPAENPHAIRSRRDLRRLNGLMQHTGFMARVLREHCMHQRPRVILELGAGDGTFMLGLAARLASQWVDVEIILLDRQPIVTPETREGFGTLQWHVETVTADVFEFIEQEEWPKVDMIIANLFLHHFSREQLARLFAKTAQLSRVFVACEPRRAALAMIGSRLLWAIGCNRVTRHDAVVSVRAGFNGTELCELWPRQPSWLLDEHAVGVFSHCFVARHVDWGRDGDL